MFPHRFPSMVGTGSIAAPDQPLDIDMQLQALTVLARAAIPPALSRLILDGRLPDAVAAAEALASHRHRAQRLAAQGSRRRLVGE